MSKILARSQSISPETADYFKGRKENYTVEKWSNTSMGRDMHMTRNRQMDAGCLQL